jgi:hypothetical protein
MTSPAMPEEARRKTAYYDFTGRYDLAKWTESEPHFLFAPARASIGERWLKFPMSNAAKADVLKRVYQACLKEITRHWKTRQKVARDPAAANRQLIEALK